MMTMMIDNEDKKTKSESSLGFWTIGALAYWKALMMIMIMIMVDDKDKKTGSQVGTIVGEWNNGGLGILVGAGMPRTWAAMACVRILIENSNNFENVGLSRSKLHL